MAICLGGMPSCRESCCFRSGSSFLVERGRVGWDGDGGYGCECEMVVFIYGKRVEPGPTSASIWWPLGFGIQSFIQDILFFI
ncbi:hypothetical protein Hanom_Chr12g01107931 [Helianthus anomalus]